MLFDKSSNGVYVNEKLVGKGNSTQILSKDVVSLIHESFLKLEESKLDFEFTDKWSEINRKWSLREVET